MAFLLFFLMVFWIAYFFDLLVIIRYHILCKEDSQIIRLLNFNANYYMSNFFTFISIFISISIIFLFLFIFMTFMFFLSMGKIFDYLCCSSQILKRNPAGSYLFLYLVINWLEILYVYFRSLLLEFSKRSPCFDFYQRFLIFILNLSTFQNCFYVSFLLFLPEVFYTILGPFFRQPF